MVVVGVCFRTYFKILDSISSKLKPLVSGTVVMVNRRDNRAMAPKRRKTFSAPRNSCRIKGMLMMQIDTGCGQNGSYETGPGFNHEYLQWRECKGNNGI